jgi:hypothetical protein
MFGWLPTGKGSPNGGTSSTDCRDKRPRKVKGITRKEIIDQFVVEAKLSKAGASTYYQLIKAKVEE